MYEEIVYFEPMSLKRHRIRNGTNCMYDPSAKDKQIFYNLLKNIPTNKMSKPIKCILEFYCKRPKSHYRSGKYSNILKDTSPKYNTNNKDLDNMVKFILDALNDKLYIDDCQIIEINCKKLYSEDEGHIYMKFEEIL